MNRKRLTWGDVYALGSVAGATLNEAMAALADEELSKTARRELVKRAEVARQDLGDKLRAMAERLGADR